MKKPRRCWPHWSLWFTPSWWKYLLAPSKWNEASWFDVIKCRMFGHPPGPYWYNPHGYEPDWTCRGCGDFLN
jgi:hypothetical protein